MTFRDQIQTCPSCQAGLESRGQRLVCAHCTGVLITEAELVAIFGEIAPDRLSTLKQVRELRVGSLSCPRCATQMTVVALDAVQADRCAAHGLWFGRGDLEKLFGGGDDAALAFHLDWLARQGGRLP